MWQVALPTIWFQPQQFSTEWWWRVTSLLVPRSWRWKRQQLQLECVCTQQERAPKTAMLNALGIDRAIHVAAKWTLMYYKVPVGAAQTKLFSLLPIYQEGIIYWGEKKKSWFLNWAKSRCHDRKGAQVRLSLVKWNVVLNSWELPQFPSPLQQSQGWIPEAYTQSRDLAFKSSSLRPH